MIGLFFEEIMAGVAASMARTEADATRAAEKAASYKGPWRRKTDAIDVKARMVEEPVAREVPSLVGAYDGYRTWLPHQRRVIEDTPALPAPEGTEAP